MLAEIDVPELVEDLERSKADLRQAEAEVALAHAQVASAISERNATQATIAQAEAHVKRAESDRSFRERQYQRTRDLHALDGIEERLVDERLDEWNASQAAELAARSAVITAKEQVAAADSRILRAKADLRVAEARVDIMRSHVARTQVLLSYTHITSPYDGVITERNYHPGAFIRSADQGQHKALLAVDRIDQMRVVVRVPDRDVPFTQPGDPSRVVFDALPATPFKGVVARVSATEDPDSRTMRVEIDVPNTNGIIRDGMYGQVEIELEGASPGVTIPSACIFGNVTGGNAKVYIVDDAKARLVDVQTGKDTGAKIEILSGLNTSQQIVVKPPSALAAGMTVNAVAAPTKSSGH